MSPSAQKALAKYGQLSLLAAAHEFALSRNTMAVRVLLAPVHQRDVATDGQVDSLIAAGGELRDALRSTGSLSYRPNGEGEGFDGSGVDVFRAAVIASGLRLFAKTGMKPNRAYTPRAMMDAATSMTGRQYKARDYERAAADLSQLCTLLKWAIDSARAAIIVRDGPAFYWVEDTQRENAPQDGPFSTHALARAAAEAKGFSVK